MKWDGWGWLELIGGVFSSSQIYGTCGKQERVLMDPVGNKIL